LFLLRTDSFLWYNKLQSEEDERSFPLNYLNEFLGKMIQLRLLFSIRRQKEFDEKVFWIHLFHSIESKPIWENCYQNLKENPTPGRRLYSIDFPSFLWENPNQKRQLKVYTQNPNVSQTQDKQSSARKLIRNKSKQRKVDSLWNYKSEQLWNFLHKNLD